MGGEPFDPKLFERVAPEEAHGETGHVKSTDVSRSTEVPEGVWTDVRVGQRTAEGTVTRSDWPGLLFDADDPTKPVVWHLKPSIFNCNRRNIRPEQVVIEKGSGAPFCPSCLSQKKKLAKKSKIKGRRKVKKFLQERKERNAFQGTITDHTKAQAPPLADNGGEIVWKESES